MATSGTYVVTKTFLELAKEIISVHGEQDWAEDADTNLVTMIRHATNAWLFQMKGPPHFLNPGEKMWQRETADVTLSAKITFDLKPSGGDCDIQVPIEIITATLKDASGNESQLFPMTLQDFQAISPKTQTGTPTRYYYEKRIDTGKLNLDFIPSDITDVIDIVYRQPLEIITANGNEIDIDNHWYRTLKYCVAYDIAGDMNSTDAALLQYIKGQAQEAIALSASFSPENTNVFFQPDRD
jgi:hypothetical protein